MENRITRRGALRAVGAGLALASTGGLAGASTSTSDHAVVARRQDGAALEHTLTIESETEGAARYELEVGGDLAQTSAHDASVNDSDTIEGSVATGILGGGRDSYAYSGDLVRFAADGDVTAYLDGEPVDLSTLVGRHTLVFAASGGDASARYEFEAMGDLTAGDALGSTASGTVTDAVATGRVGSIDAAYGRACYTYTGGLLRFTATDDVVAYLDGKRVNLSTLVDRHTITIDGSESDSAMYDLETSSSLKQATPVGSSAGEETVEVTTASGSVGGWRDSYEFTGELVRFTTDGSPQVLLDGQKITPRDIVPVHTLTLVGDGRIARYSVSVEANLQRDDALGASLNPGDSINNPWENVATGTVTTGRDSYTFTGDLEWVTVPDSVDVILDGEPYTDRP